MSLSTNHTAEVRLVLVTFPNLDIARQIGTLLVERQLAACVNLLNQRIIADGVAIKPVKRT